MSIVLITIVNISLLYIHTRKNNTSDVEVENLELDYGDVFDLKPYCITNDDEIIIDNSNIKIVFSLSSGCSSCIDALDMVETLDHLTIFKDMSINIVWLDNVPMKRIEKHDFSRVIQYSLNNKVQFSGSYPHFYIFEQDKVIFATADLNVFQKKIMNMVSKDDKEITTYNDIMHRYNLEEDGNKKVVFLTEENSKEIEEIKKSKDFKENNLLLVLNYKTTDIGEYIYDKGEIYKDVFSITEYPSLVEIQDKEIVIKTGINVLY